jgi:hypothetical protein
MVFLRLGDFDMASSARKRVPAPPKADPRPLAGRNAADLSISDLMRAGARAAKAARERAAKAGLSVPAVRDGQPVWVRPDGRVEPTTWDEMDQRRHD